MKEFSKYVGLDTHKDTIAVAVADAQGGKARYFGAKLTRSNKMNLSCEDNGCSI